MHLCRSPNGNVPFGIYMADSAVVAGAFAATALLDNLLQLWFARLSISEVFTCMSFLGGMYLLVIAKRRRTPKRTRNAAWSAAAFGLLYYASRSHRDVVAFVLLVLFLNGKQWSREGLCRYWALALARQRFGPFLA